jgi:hypothetical protein
MARQKKSSPDQGQIVSAQVILWAASGKSIRNQSITADNVKEYIPSAEAIAAATQYFAAAGFDVGFLVGNNFSITASVRTFEQVFGTRLVIEERGAIKAMSGRQASLELPIQNLKRDLLQYIEAVSFTAPPDFGPTQF